MDNKAVNCPPVLFAPKHFCDEKLFYREVDSSVLNLKGATRRVERFPTTFQPSREGQQGLKWPGTNAGEQ